MSPTPKTTRALSVLLWFAAVTTMSSVAPASAQAPRLTPGDFTRARAQLVPGRVGTQFPPAVTGRQLDLPPLGGNARRAAFVLVDSGQVNDNGFPAFALVLVVMVARDGAWHPHAAVPVPVGYAQYLYEEQTPLRIARMEDVDDDGEAELFVVIESNTESLPAVGYCSERRTLVFDVGGATPVVTANLASNLDCQGDTVETVEGTVLVRDTDGDGHRDLVVRRRICPGDEWDEATEEFVTPRCAAAVLTTWRWRAADDTYVQVPGGG